jgi:hypothetical protein
MSAICCESAPFPRLNFIDIVSRPKRLVFGTTIMRADEVEDGRQTPESGEPEDSKTAKQIQTSALATS